MKIDIHTHVLPGVDDGPDEWDECLEMLAINAKNGVTHLIATPHCVPWERGAKAEKIIELCQRAEKKLQEAYGLEINIYPGHEIYYVPGITEKIKQGKVLTLAGTRYVLVEFKPASTYQELFRAAREFADAGYTPIYAHVERYGCLSEKAKIDELKNMGVLFQVNIKSLQQGFFDKDCRKVKNYLKREMIDFLASDMHTVNDETLLSSSNLQWVHSKMSREYQRKLLQNNGLKILTNAKR